MSLPFIRLLVRSLFVRSRGVKKMTLGCKKVMTRGRRSKNKERAKKGSCSKSGFSNLKCRHKFFEVCVGRVEFPSNLQDPVHYRKQTTDE
jgi:hypothetical protein